MAKVVIVDYGAGNLRSVARAVRHAGVEPVITSDPEAVDRARAVILPGVGAAADTMANLRRAKLVEPLREYIAADRPFLGVCMGMQALFDVSEEGGEHECLGVLPGRIVRFPRGLTVPHMGWNTLRMERPHPVLEGVEDGAYAYFVHSYYPRPRRSGADDRQHRARRAVRLDRRAGQPDRDAVPPGEVRSVRPAPLRELPAARA